MPDKRIIPLLSYHNEELVKTIQFKNRQYIGDALNAVKIFNEKFVDEIILLDIGPEKRANYDINFSFLKYLLEECFIPVTYGGAIKSIDDAKKVFDLGIDKISINSAFLNDISLVNKIANKFGSQSVVISLDIKQDIFKNFYIYNYKNENSVLNLDLKNFLIKIQESGAGEILINSVDHDGKMKGMNKKLINYTNNICSIPIIYCGGVGSLMDIKEVFKLNVDAIACTSFFCFYGKNKSVLITYPYEDFGAIK